MPTIIKEQGACASRKVYADGTPITAIFYEPAHQTRAKQMCMGCPVRLECLHHAIRNREHWGVWGGTTERQREREFAGPYSHDGALPSLCKKCGRAFTGKGPRCRKCAPSRGRA